MGEARMGGANLCSTLYYFHAGVPDMRVLSGDLTDSLVWHKGKEREESHYYKGKVTLSRVARSSALAARPLQG